MPVAEFRRRESPVEEVHAGVYVFQPTYLGGKLNQFGLARKWQWNNVARQIAKLSKTLSLQDPVFIYSHIEHMASLCDEMKANGFPLIHICMDYPEPFQYQLIAMSDCTLVIPKGVFHKLKAKFGEKIQQIPQSVHLPFAERRADHSALEPPEIAPLARPRLGYLGPIYARLNLPMLQTVLTSHPEWQFLCFGDTRTLPLPNVHSLSWQKPSELNGYLSSFDAGVMPYDCFNEKNLHCAPLKLLDYFLAGLPVVSTPTIPLWEFKELLYFGDTATEFADAVEAALAEPANSPKRERRVEVARSHSTEALGRRLEEILDVRTPSKRSMT
jgi:hypothetical protein